MNPTALLDRASLPERIDDVDALQALMSRPTPGLAEDLARAPGDILVLGGAGKMGPTLAAMAKAAAPDRRVLGAARFSEPGLRDWLAGRGVETVACDLLDPVAIAGRPRLPNVVYMAGRKFGAEGDLALTWAMNAHVPALVAQAFPVSRIVSFSTGCVYPFVPVSGTGATEETPPDAPGEYAQSCIGRERMFEYFSGRLGTPGRLFRLNYAIDMRYGVLFDIAAKGAAGRPVDVTMGHVNVIWQGDACAQALRCLAHCTVPASPINVSGPEILSVRDLARRFGERLGREPIVTGPQAETAWLTDTTLAQRLFGPPVVGLDHMIAWTADWVARSMPSHGKPTKFEVRDGRY